MPRWFVAMLSVALLLLLGVGWWIVHVFDRSNPGDLKVFLLSPGFASALMVGCATLVVLIFNRFADLQQAHHERRVLEIKAAIALTAEIRANIERQRGAYAVAERRRILAPHYKTLTSEKPPKKPALPGAQGPSATAPVPPTRIGTADETNFVYESLKTEVLTLPIEVIGPIVRYYNLNDMLSKAIDASRKMDGISNKRWLKYYVEIYKLADVADSAANTAMAAIWRNLSKEQRAHVLPEPPTARLHDESPKELLSVSWLPFPADDWEKDVQTLLATTKDRTTKDRKPPAPPENSAGEVAEAISDKGEDGTGHA